MVGGRHALHVVMPRDMVCAWARRRHGGRQVAAQGAAACILCFHRPPPRSRSPLTALFDGPQHRGLHSVRLLGGALQELNVAPADILRRAVQVQPQLGCQVLVWVRQGAAGVGTSEDSLQHHSPPALVCSGAPAGGGTAPARRRSPQTRSARCAGPRRPPAAGRSGCGARWPGRPHGSAQTPAQTNRPARARR